MTNAIIWTKSRSQDCVKAVILAQRMGLTVEVRNIDGNQWDLAKLQAAIPGAKTLPQIVIGDTVLGGLAELVAKSKEQQAVMPKVSLKTKEEKAESIQAKSAVAHEAKKAAMSDKMQAYRAKMAENTPEQRQAAMTRAQAKRAAESFTTEISHEQHVAEYEAKKAAYAEKISAAKAKNADGRAVRIAAVKSRIESSKAAQRQKVNPA